MEENFELQAFNSMDEIAEHNTADDCYVVADYLVFDLSDTVADSELVSVEDCGTDVSQKGDVTAFNEAHAENFIGYMESILQMADDEEIEEKIAEEEARDAQTQTTEEKDDSTFFTTENMAISAAVVILLVVLVSVVVMLNKKKAGK